MNKHISAQLEFDLRTGIKTAIGRGRNCDSQRSACADLNRERAEGILRAAAFVAESAVRNFAIESQLPVLCARWDVPLIRLEDLGITINIDQDLESTELIALPPGAEADPYHDLQHDVVYKLYKVGKGAPSGRKCKIVRAPEDDAPSLPEEERYRVAECEADLRDIMVKLALLNEIGALPTEIIGLSQSADFLVVKQPFAKKSSNSFSKDLADVIKATKATKPQKLGLNCAIVWLQGRAFIMNDLRRENIMIDRSGSPAIIDALVGEIPSLFISKFSALKAAIDDAENLRNGNTPRNSSLLRVPPDEDL